MFIQEAYCYHDSIFKQINIFTPLFFCRGTFQADKVFQSILLISLKFSQTNYDPKNNVTRDHNSVSFNIGYATHFNSMHC